MGRGAELHGTVETKTIYFCTDFRFFFQKIKTSICDRMEKNLFQKRLFLLMFSQTSYKFCELKGYK